MTIEDFRGNPLYTSRMREIMDDPVMELAFEAMRGSSPPIDPDPSAPEIASVRALSQMTGYYTYGRVFQSLAIPIFPMTPPPEATFEPEA